MTCTQYYVIATFVIAILAAIHAAILAIAAFLIAMPDTLIFHISSFGTFFVFSISVCRPLLLYMAKYSFKDINTAECFRLQTG